MYLGRSNESESPAAVAYIGNIITQAFGMVKLVICLLKSVNIALHPSVVLVLLDHYNNPPSALSVQDI